MGKLLPIIMVIIGVAAGGAAGFFLKPPPPPPEETAAADGEPAAAGEGGGAAAAGEAGADGEGDGEEAVPTHEYVKLANQFVVPILDDGRVSSMVIMSLSLEVGIGGTEAVYGVEPKLRDSFLQVLFDHANTGGFRGTFTSTENMDVLRRALREAARSVMGSAVTDVLVSDILRQDIR